jgi:HEAT repeat protein/cyclophilin family peptidyl-prolyl cis-trans isomerase
MMCPRFLSVLALSALLSQLSACARTDIPACMMKIQAWEDARVIPGDSLYSYLDESSYVVRAAAALALGRIGRPEAVPYLAKTLRDDRRPEVREQAAFALGLIPTSASAVALLAGAERELSLMAGSGRRGSPEVLGETLLALGRVDQPGTAAEVVRGLLHPHPLVREQALESLALLADSTSVDEIVRASHDPVESVAWRAAYALGKFKDQRAVEREIELLGHSSALVRAFAAKGLGQIGPPLALSAEDALISRLHESEWTVRVNAARALGRLGAKEASAPLLGMLDDEVFHARAAALGALQALAPISDPAPLLAACQDTCSVVRLAAYAAVAANLPDEAAAKLREGLEDSSGIVRGECYELLGEHPDQNARATLTAAFNQHTDEEIRTHAVEGIASLGGEGAIAVLKSALNDADWTVATTAATDLGKLGDESSIDPLLACYESWNQRQEVGVCEAVLTALGELKAEKAIATLKEVLSESNDRRLRVAARNALAQILPEKEAAGLPKVEDIIMDVRPIQRSPKQPPLVRESDARELILHTSRGQIVIDLYFDVAPQSCESFARLAESGFFDGLDFHRVVPNFVIQGGDPLGTGWGDAGYELRSEWSSLRFERGTVGIATSGKDTGSCQLFITHSPQPHLNARYTIIGRVAEGMNVVDAIQIEDTFTAEVVWQAPR